MIPAISGSQRRNVLDTWTLRRWEPEIAGINFGLILVYIVLFLALLYVLYITRTGFSIRFQWYHSLDTPKTSWEDIRVFLPSPAIKVAISDQLSLYYTQSLLRPTLTILLGPVF